MTTTNPTRDDGYQGIQDASTLTPEQDEAAALVFKIADIESAAQDAEDREQLGRASKLRAQARSLNARLANLRG